MEMRSKIRTRRKKTHRFLWTLLVLLGLVAIVTIGYSVAQAPLTNAADKYEARAINSGAVTKVTDFYQTSRDGRYYTVVGKNKTGKTIAVIYQDKAKGKKKAKSMQLQLAKGYTAKEALTKVKTTYNPAKITATGMAIYKGVAVWEVTFTDQKGNLNFVTIQFSNGKIVRTILNL
jgi:uncharacterized protein YpmB